MKKAYIFIYDGTVGTREEVQAAVNSISMITHWRYDVPSCFYIISEGSAQDLYDAFTAINGTKGRFFFMEASANRQGQMLPDTWYLLSNKTYKPKTGGAT